MGAIHNFAPVGVAFAKTGKLLESNDQRAESLISYLKKHSNLIQSKGSNHYYRQVLWQLLSIDFKTLSGPLKRELMNLLFTWSGANLSDSDRASLEAELKKKIDGELQGYWDKMRLATLKEVDARDLTKELRQAIKDAFGRLMLDKAGMKRLEILDKDEERFVNEMLFAGVMPSTSSDLSNLGNNLITNLAGNVINGGFSSEQLATIAKNIAKVLGIKESTTGKLLQEAVDSKIVQDVVAAGKMPEILNRVQDILSRLNDSVPTVRDQPIPQGSQPSLGDLFQKATQNDGKATTAAATHTNAAPKIQNARTRTAKVPGDLAQSGIRPFNSGTGAETSSSRSAPTSSTGSATATQPPAAMPDAKLEAAREVVDPRELLGGSYVFRNPKYTATDPLLQDKKHTALGDYGSKYFEQAQEASIRAGSKIGSCDVKETRSDKLCELEACKNSKPCKCYEGMLKTVQEFDLKRAEKEKEAAAGAPTDVVASRIQETGNTVEASVREALKKKYDEIREKLKNPSISEDKRKELLEGAKNVEELEKREAIERSFYIKKVLLNGVMNTKTPACVLNKGRYGIGSKRDPDTEPEWIFPKENYCHQFDIEPHEPFVFDPQKPGKGLSQQDSILLRLALRTLDGLEESNPDKLPKNQILDGYKTSEIRISEAQVCTSRSLCTLPDPTSKKPLFYRIFADETKDVRTRKLFDGETDNTIARTLLRCFGRREWGGMLIRMLEDLQPLAVDCAVPAAKWISKDVSQSSFLQAACSWKEEEGLGTVIDATEGERTEARDRVGRKFRNSSGKVFPFESKGSPSVKSFCQAIKSRYEPLLDVLRGATLLNPVELCSEARFKEYRKEGQVNDSKHQKK